MYIPLEDYNWIVTRGLDPRSLLLRIVHQLQLEEGKSKELTDAEVQEVVEAHRRKSLPALPPSAPEVDES